MIRREYAAAYRHPDGELVQLGEPHYDIERIRARLNRKGTLAMEMHQHGYQTLVVFRDVPDWQEL